MKKTNKNIKLRIIAGILVVIMVFTYWAGALTSIKIAADSSNEAMKYLAENTDYVKAGRGDRVLNLMRTVRRTEDLEYCYLKASMDIGSAKYADALIYIDKCLALCDPMTDRSFYTELLTKKGCLLTLTGDNEAALEVLKEVTEKAPDAADTYLVIAQIYFEMNDIERLAESTASYLELRPDDTEMRITYLQTLSAMDDNDKAKQQGEMIASAASSTDGQKDEANHILALLALRDEDFDEALKYLKGIRDTEIGFKDVSYDMGVCYMSNGEYDKAIDCFSQSIELGYNIQGSLYSRGVCEISTDPAEYESAYEDLKAASEYEGADRDEETASLAGGILEAAFTVEEQD